MVAKISGQILGISAGADTAPYTQVTVTPQGPGFDGPVTLLVLSPSDLTGWQIGQNVALYLAAAPADISAIEAAVTVVQIDSST